MLAAALAAAPAAAAHAQLETTLPADGAVLASAPAELVLEFTEPVDTALGGVTVYDPAGAALEVGALAQRTDESVSVPVAGDLADGTYTVVWHVVSADTHPVRGAFGFSVGEPSASTVPLPLASLSAGSPEIVDVLFTADRFLTFALMLLAAGGFVAVALVLPEAQRTVRVRLLGVVAGAASSLVVVSLFGIVLQGASAAGTSLQSVDGDVISEVIRTRFGAVWLIRAVLAGALVLAALALQRAGRGRGTIEAIGLVAAGALVITPAAAGHASSSGIVSFVADVAHVEAAAVWAGGLALLTLALVWTAPGTRWTLAARVVPRFSALAVVSVAVLLAAGALNGILQIRPEWSGLWDTTYGQLLLAKIGLFLPILGLAAWNNRAAVPPIAREDASPVLRRRFLRSLVAELAIVLAVVGVTAVLVAEPPPKALAGIPDAGPYSATVTEGTLAFDLTVDPAATGGNVIHLYLFDESGRPALADEAQISATLTAESLGPIAFREAPAGPGHWVVTGARFPAPGDWEVRVEARRGDFDQTTAVFEVPIR